MVLDDYRTSFPINSFCIRIEYAGIERGVVEFPCSVGAMLKLICQFAASRNIFFFSSSVLWPVSITRRLVPAKTGNLLKLVAKSPRNFGVSNCWRNLEDDSRSDFRGIRIEVCAIYSMKLCPSPEKTGLQIVSGQSVRFFCEQRGF